MGTRIIIVILVMIGFFAYSETTHAGKKSQKKQVVAKQIKNSKKKSRAKIQSSKKSSRSSRKLANLSPISMGDEPRGPQQPLQVKGQARQLSMMLVLKNEKDSINFVHLRTDYQKEIVNTEF
jgi:anionic cell wall polymer biosynthesis LytR-Cps2A-Psr (LCP) family protein